MNQNGNLKDTIYQEILNSIISDEYKPGEILNEKSLVLKYGVSKSPVREALITLCSHHILKAIPRYGYEVVKITRETISDILQFRQILESGCLKSCYKSITKQQLDELSKINNLCIDTFSNDDMWIHWDHNQDFHLLLISYSNNQYAYDKLKESMDILKRAYAQFYYDKWSPSVITNDMKSHEPLLDAILKQDIETSCSLLQKDLQDFGY